jgi:hypothetical protein
MARNRRFPAAAVALLLPMLLVAWLPAESRVVGQILDLKGRVEIQRGKGKALPGTLVFPLETRDVLHVGEGGAVEVVLFAKGVRFRLAGAGSVQIAQETLVPISGAKPQAVTELSPTLRHRLRTPVRGGLTGLVVRGGNGAGFGPSHPSPDGAVRATPVTLRWSGLIDATQLHLQISAGEKDVDHKDLAADVREYEVPKGVLQPGKEYDWSVTALRGAAIGSWCRATLRLLPAAEVAEVAVIEKECAGSASVDTASLLLLAAAYERFDMKEDALARYQAVLRLRPGDAGVQAAVKRLSGGGS